jgi:MFS family permease
METTHRTPDPGALPAAGVEPTVAPPPHRPAFLSALRNRDFRYLWTAYVCSTFVQRMDAVVLGWLVLEMTHSAFLVGLISAVRRLGALLGPWTGVVADRLDRRYVAITALTVMATVVFCLALLVALRRLEVWHLFVATTLSGIVWAFFQPAQQSLQADILKPGELANGISLTNMAMNLTTIGGPILAGLLLSCCRPARRVWDWSDADMVLSLNWSTYDAQRLYAATSHGRVLTSHDYGMSWGPAPFALPETTARALALEGAATGVQWAYVVMLGLHLIQLASYVCMHSQPRPPHRQQTSIWHNLREGMRYSMHEAGLWTPLVLAALVNFVAFPLQMNLLPVFASEIFSVGAAGLGWLGAALGVGALLGSLLMINLGTLQRAGPLMLIGTGLWSLFELVFALTPSYPVALAVLVVTGMAQAVCLTNMSILLLSTSTSDMRGRIMGLRSLAVAPLFLGSLLSGAAAEHLGAPLTTIGCALVGLAVTLCVLPWVPRGVRQ